MRRLASFPSRSQGFTLIELLTVIAIIGILAAILIPVVGRVRSSARQSANASNLREITMAVHLFAGDNEDALPFPRSASTRWWPAILYPYVETIEIFQRPGQTEGFMEAEGTRTLGRGGQVQGELIPWSYWINGGAGWSPFPGDSVGNYESGSERGRRLAHITEQSRTVAFVDGNGPWQFRPDRNALDGTNERFYYWESGTTTVSWLDGHVDSRRPEDLSKNDFLVVKVATRTNR